MQTIYIEGVTNHMLSHIADRYPTHGASHFYTAVGMTMEDDIRSGSVDGFTQQITAKKRIDLLFLTQQSVCGWRVMHQNNTVMSLKALQSLAQILGEAFGMTNEGL